MYYDGKLYHPYKEEFKVNLSPNEAYKGRLAYISRDNKMILAVRAGENGQMELKNVEVNFE